MMNIEKKGCNQRKKMTLSLKSQDYIPTKKKKTMS